jgi:23S rRNA pseudouridine1911/1915/1917 synthase
MSRTQLQRLIDNEAVWVNGRTPKASTGLRGGDVVEIVVPPPPPTEIQPEEIPLTVLHEDDDIVVLNKQADLIVHPARSHLNGTMVNALAWHFRHASAVGGALSSVGGEFARPGVVHRLDRNTTGAIVFAKRDEAHWRLGHQFERRTVDKRYLALVHGEIETWADVIDQPIGNHPSREKGYREKYVVRHDEQGRSATTIYRVRELYAGYTLVELELKTGRTHQIRVHMSWLGHPIVGDDMYGGKALRERDIRAGGPDDVVIGRQALHAATLGFTHPTTGAAMRFTAPAPADLRRAVALLRKHRPGRGTVSVAGATVDVSEVVG